MTGYMEDTICSEERGRSPVVDASTECYSAIKQSMGQSNCVGTEEGW